MFEIKGAGFLRRRLKSFLNILIIWLTYVGQETERRAEHSHDVGSFAYVPLQQYHSKPPKQLRAAERARCLPKPGLVAHDRPG